MNNSNKIDLEAAVQRFKKLMSEDIRQFLIEERMLSDEIVDLFDLGFDDERISIPVLNDNFEVVDVRLYLQPGKRKNKRTPKVLPINGGDGSPKLYPQQTMSLVKLKRHREGVEKVDNLETLEKLERLTPVYDSIINWNILFVVEGEMDALALLSQGFLAITNTCGANSWSKTFTDDIADLKMAVVICMDADDAGEAGATTRADALNDLELDVSVVTWPHDCKLGHDVTDELKIHGIDGFLSVVENAKRYRDVYSLDEIEAEEVAWMFRPYFALGKVSLVEGHPGIGKTFLVLKIAAEVTTGGHDLLEQEQFPPGFVLLMTAEDGIADTIKPRIEKMGPDLKKVLIPKELFTLDTKGFEILEGMIKRYRPRLVVLDPMMPFLDAKKDSNKASDMRPFFKQLSKLADKYKCAIIVTRHLAKNPEQKGVTAGLGSIDISAAVRSIVQVSEDSKNKGLKKVFHVKCNIGQKGIPFGYRLSGGTFQWAEIPEEDETEKEKEIDRVAKFLKEILKNGPVDANKISDEAKIHGFSKSTLNRAKDNLGIESKKNGTFWQWYLPGAERKPEAKETQEAQGFQDSQGSFADLDEDVGGDL